MISKGGRDCHGDIAKPPDVYMVPFLLYKLYAREKSLGLE